MGDISETGGYHEECGACRLWRKACPYHNAIEGAARKKKTPAQRKARAQKRARNRRNKRARKRVAAELQEGGS